MAKEFPARYQKKTDPVHASQYYTVSTKPLSISRRYQQRSLLGLARLAEISIFFPAPAICRGIFLPPVIYTRRVKSIAFEW